MIDISIARFDARYIWILRRNNTPSPKSHTTKKAEPPNRIASVHPAGSLSLNCLVFDPRRTEVFNMASRMAMVGSLEVGTLPVSGRHQMLAVLSQMLSAFA
jgi:hypothetical protein